MKTLEALEFKAELDIDLKEKSFSKVFSDSERVSQFTDFLENKIGKKWLTSKNGISFKNWNEE